MSYVLYYSKYCASCKSILYKVSRNEIKEEIHFLCIDKRKRIGDKVYIILNDGKELLMPEEIKKVPALLLINRGSRIIYGKDIENFLNPILNKQEINKIEPLAFSNFEMGSSHSDNYSFLDQDSKELSTKGVGGLRQMHAFATYNGNDSIETPPETFTTSKIESNNVSKLLDKMQEERNKSINLKN
jgi:hypothetical protein